MKDNNNIRFQHKLSDWDNKMDSNLTHNLDKKLTPNLHLQIHPIFENQYSELDDVLLPHIDMENI